MISANRIGAVVVTFNSAETIVACVSSLLASPHVSGIVVVDNASTDGTTALIEDLDARVRVVLNDSNTGFGAAANQGAALFETSWLAFVNPDAVATSEAIDRLLTALRDGERSGVWAAGPALLNSAGAREYSARAFPLVRNAAFNRRWIDVAPAFAHLAGSFLMMDRDLGATFQCDWLSGAFFICRRATFAELGGFDESFFMYYEDVDLFRRATKSGRTALFVGSAIAHHAIAGSSRKVAFRAGWWRIRSFVHYYRLYLRRGVLSDVGLVLALSAGVAATALGRFRRGPAPSAE